MDHTSFDTLLQISKDIIHRVLPGVEVRKLDDYMDELPSIFIDSTFHIFWSEEDNTWEVHAEVYSPATRHEPES